MSDILTPPPSFLGTLQSLQEAQEATRPHEIKLLGLLSAFNFRELTVSLPQKDTVAVYILGQYDDFRVGESFHSMYLRYTSHQASSPQMMAAGFALHGLLTTQFLHSYASGDTYIQSIRRVAVRPDQCQFLEHEIIQCLIATLESIPATEWPPLSRDQRAELLKRGDLSARAASAVMLAPWNPRDPSRPRARRKSPSR